MQNLITKPAWTAPHFVFQSVSGPTDLIAQAPAPRLGMEHFVGSSVRVQTTSVTLSMVVPKVQVILFVSLHYLLFSILLSVCFFIIDWIKMRFVLILVYRKVKSSIRSNWLQYKTKSIRVKSGWYLFSTGNNSCGYEICKYNFSTWQNWQYSTKVLNAR